MEVKFKLNGYSERGIMNAVFYHIALKKDTDLLEKIINEANIEGIDEIDSVSFFMEGSLSKFGDPDLVIKIVNKTGTHIIFVEAKVSSYPGIQKAYEGFQKSIKSKEASKNYFSNLFYQLYAKALFVKWDEDRLINGDKDIRGVERKRGENDVVKDFVTEIKDSSYHYHYCAIIPDDIPTEDKYIHPFKETCLPEIPADVTISYISWKQIEKLASDKEHEFITNTFFWNRRREDKGNGQIY